MRDKVNPVVFSLTASLAEPQTAGIPLQLQSLNQFPVLSQGRTLTDKVEVTQPHS